MHKKQKKNQVKIIDGVVKLNPIKKKKKKEKKEEEKEEVVLNFFEKQKLKAQNEIEEQKRKEL